jgi:small-conductance mechanosensitive channel
MLQHLRSDPLVRMLGHTTVTLFLSTVAYYVVPLRFDRVEPWTVGRFLLALLMLGLLVVFFRAQGRWSSRRQTEDYVRIQWLLTALYALVLVFALTYAAVAVQVPGQFAGLENRTDALYFSVTLVATVGFGDIHPVGGAARLLATTHMVFNLIYLGTAIRMLVGRAAVPSPDGEAGHES